LWQECCAGIGARESVRRVSAEESWGQDADAAEQLLKGDFTTAGVAERLG